MGWGRERLEVYEYGNYMALISYLFFLLGFSEWAAGL